MKRNLVRLVTLSLSLCLLVTLMAGYGSALASDDGKIYFGVTAGITGDAPIEGEAMIRSITLGCDIINAQGGVLGKELVPVFEDVLDRIRNVN